MRNGSVALFSNTSVVDGTVATTLFAGMHLPPESKPSALPNTRTLSPALTVKVSGVLDRFNLWQLCLPHIAGSEGGRPVPLLGDELDAHHRSGSLTVQTVCDPCINVSFPPVKTVVGGTAVSPYSLDDTAAGTQDLVVHHSNAVTLASPVCLCVE